MKGLLKRVQKGLLKRVLLSRFMCDHSAAEHSSIAKLKYVIKFSHFLNCPFNNSGNAKNDHQVVVGKTQQI